MAALPKSCLVFCCAFFVLIATPFAQDPDIETDERSALEDLYRSSDHEGEIPTAFRDRHGQQKKRVSVPKGATRLGCVCMNGAFSDAHSTGACSGSGGVRYWLYRTTGGDTVRVLTGRHERHPQPLDSAELSETNRPKPKRSGITPALQLQPIIISPVTTTQMPEQWHNGGGWFDWSDAATITGAGISLFLILRLLLGWVHTHQPLVRYALRHLLRFGKRPAPRKSRKTATKTRL